MDRNRGVEHVPNVFVFIETLFQIVCQLYESSLLAQITEERA